MPSRPAAPPGRVPRRCPRPACAPSTARSRRDRACARPPRHPRPGPSRRRRGAISPHIPGSCAPRSRRRHRLHRHARPRSTPRSARRSPRSSRSRAARGRAGPARGGRCRRCRRPLISRASSPLPHPRGQGGGVNLVVDVRYVCNECDFVALMDEQTRQQREHDVGASIADVDPAVYGRPAGVDPDPPSAFGCDRQHLAGTRVVQADRSAHVAATLAPAGTSGRRRPVGWPHVAGRPSSSQRLIAVEEAFRSLPDRYPRRRSGLRRHLPDHAVRPRPHLGGALHEPRRPRPQGRDAPALRT